ncbi:MAG TPA: glycosyltransferase family 39 protein, partial [Acidobacteriaceae bacterium]|nr:glycosyltransferase family 39 protein [Acidobacteriaceae bacterium]
MQNSQTVVAAPVSTAAASAVRPRTETLALVLIAGVIALAHLLTNSRYGIHRDELEFLVNARHLDWGFVAYPPLDPFLERIALSLFGLSLVGLRLFSVIAQVIALFVTGLMARDLGGGRLAQIAATVCVALSPLPLFNGTEFQYTSFDFLWWVLIAFCVIRLLRSENPRWWLAIGLFTGLGVMTKYAILFFVAGILGGFILTRARRYLLSPYFFAALALTTLIALPNLIWQVHHHFISYTFLHHIHVRDVGEGRANGFLRDQFWICTNLASAPLWIAGLVGFFFSRRYRVLGWMALIPVALFFLSKGRGYYTAGVYPMLMAMGGVQAERWLPKQKAGWRYAIEGIFFAAVVFCGAYICAIILPIASSGPLMRFAFANNGDLREETGWEQ